MIHNYRETMGSVKKGLVRRPIIAIYIIYLMIVAFFVPNFFSFLCIRNYLAQCSEVIIIACGFMLVLLNGCMDFSSSAVIGLGSYICAFLINKDTGLLLGNAWAVPLGILSIFVISMVINIFNGFCITVLKIPSFITTLATQMAFTGVALYISQSTTISNLPEAFTRIGTNSIFHIPIPIIIAIFTAYIIHFILMKTTFGKKVYAMGTNHSAATISGIKVKKTIFQLFLINGLLVAIGTTVLSAREGVGMAALGGNRVLDFVAAAIIGGTSVYGGSGTVLGTVLGAMLIVLINNSLNLIGSQWYIIMIFKGLIIILMAIVDSRRVLMEKNI